MGKNRHIQETRSGVIFGLLLLLVGVGLVLTNTGMMPREIRSIFFSWQMLLIAIGLISIFHRNFSFGFILLGVGGFFILPKLQIIFPDHFYFIPADFISTYWPALLIVGGVAIIISAFYKPHKTYHYNADCGDRRRKRHYTSGEDGHFDKTVVFGEGEHIILEPVFIGGKASVVFGSMTIDLRKSEIPEGETFLDVEVVFGTLTVVVPPDCKIKPAVSTVFGGFTENRVISEAVASNRVLTIAGESVFGTVEIRD